MLVLLYKYIIIIFVIYYTLIIINILYLEFLNISIILKYKSLAHISWLKLIIYKLYSKITHAECI